MSRPFDHEKLFTAVRGSQPVWTAVHFVFTDHARAAAYARSCHANVTRVRDPRRWCREWLERGVRVVLDDTVEVVLKNGALLSLDPQESVA